MKNRVTNIIKLNLILISSCGEFRPTSFDVLLGPVHIVAEKCDCRRKRRDNGDSRRIRRQSPFSATMWTGF